jgi:hypothetical protein
MAGDNPFRKKEVPAAVQNEISDRATNRINWVASRFPWISVLSMSSICDAKYTTLSSITSDLYESNTFQRPNPVITGLDVKKQGELGTTRRATIKITAFTDSQIVELQKCYFIPGMSVRVEWGWTTNADLSTMHYPPAGFVRRASTDSVANRLMKVKSAGSPNYEGLQGIVANFSYNLNRDNYWECTVEIIAAAEAFSKTKVNDYSCPECVAEHKNENGDKTVQKKSNLYTYFYLMFEDFFKAVPIYSGLLSKVAALDGKTITQTQYKFNAAGRDENGGEKLSFMEKVSPSAINQPDTVEAFISWSTLEAAVNAYSVPTAADAYIFGRISSKEMPIAYNRWVTSADPRVCVLPGTVLEQQFPAAKLRFGKVASCVGTDENGKKAIILDRVMLNVTMLMLELKNVEKQGDGSLSVFLLNVLNKVNEACGNLWEFDIVSTSSDDKAGSEAYPTLTVIDTKMAIKGSTSITYLIPSTPTNSVLRDMKLDMKLTDSMKTQALYANVDVETAIVTAGGGGCDNGFKLFRQGSVKNLAMGQTPDKPKCNECKTFNSGVAIPGHAELMTNLQKDITDDTVTAVKSELIRLYGLDASTAGSDQHCQGMPVPFEFNCTMDGIGGFVFGQLISCDRIPQQIRDNFDFQVTSVEHSITPNDWTTTINTIARTRPA